MVFIIQMADERLLPVPAVVYIAFCEGLGEILPQPEYH